VQLPPKRKASENLINEDQLKNSPEEDAVKEEAKADGDRDDPAKIEVAEKCSAIIIKRSVLTRKVVLDGGWLRHHIVDGEDVAIEM
jgi:hypothetical protein